MKKLLLFFIFITLFFVYAPQKAEAASTGIYFCQWGIENGQPKCLLSDAQCSANFKADCEKFTTQGTCNNNQQADGNDCVPDVVQPPPGNGCGAGSCNTTTDCAGGLACLGADSGVSCSGHCACPPSKCNGPLDCNGALATCTDIVSGQWCSGSCSFSESSDDPATTDKTQFIGYCQGKNGIDTGIGCIPIGNLNNFSAFFLRWGLGLSGGLAIIMLIYASFLIMTSAGNPTRLESGKELLFSVMSGIILMTFCVFVLRLIGINILGIF